MVVGVGGVARFPPLPAVPAGERRGGWGSDGAAAAPASVLILLAVAELTPNFCNLFFQPKMPRRVHKSRARSPRDLQLLPRYYEKHDETR